MMKFISKGGGVVSPAGGETNSSQHEIGWVMLGPQMKTIGRETIHYQVLTGYEES